MYAATEVLTDGGSYEREPDSTVVVRWADEHAVFVKMHTRDDEKVRNQLAFREYLRANPEARREYERVKREAATEHPNDRKAYTRNRSAVTRSIVERARTEGYYEDLPEFV